MLIQQLEGVETRADGRTGSLFHQLWGIKEQSNTSLMAQWCDILSAVPLGAARWRFRVFQNSAEHPVIALN